MHKISDQCLVELDFGTNQTTHFWVTCHWVTEISNFRTWISLKSVGQSWSNFMCSINGVWGRLHKVLGADWIKTMVSMATVNPHWLIMGKMMSPSFQWGKQCLWTIYFRVICLDCWKDHIWSWNTELRWAIVALWATFYELRDIRLQYSREIIINIQTLRELSQQKPFLSESDNKLALCICKSSSCFAV